MRIGVGLRSKILRYFNDFASGNRQDRTNFKRMMVDASKRKFDSVLFWAMTDFSSKVSK